MDPEIKALRDERELLLKKICTNLIKIENGESKIPTKTQWPKKITKQKKN